MDIRKIEQNGHVYMFVNETWETYHAWGHKTTLFIDDVERATKKIRYYNRTWECYTYQTTMRCCIDDLIADYTKNFTDNYKDFNGIKRLTKNKKINLLHELHNTEKYLELQGVMHQLNYSR